ncbi:MAG: hypothetical protein ACI4E3_00670 [Candidatus Fimousia sp.]
MGKTKSLSDLIEELQKENERLQFLQKLFNQACKNEFGYDVKSIHQILEKKKIYEHNIEKQSQKNIFSPNVMKLN